MTDKTAYALDEEAAAELRALLPDPWQVLVVDAVAFGAEPPPEDPERLLARARALRAKAEGLRQRAERRGNVARDWQRLVDDAEALEERALAVRRH